MFKKSIYNTIMKDGKKHIAEKVVLKVLKNLQKTSKNCQSVFKLSVLNSSPILFLKHIKRKRKQTKSFPFILKPELRISYGLKTLISVCRKKNNFFVNLNQEILDSSNKVGKSFNYKIETHKSAFSKKKFSNYRWF